ncbi:hypothetical protein WJX79_008517 [Trebouxia sp. C0005]
MDMLKSAAGSYMGKSGSGASSGGGTDWSQLANLGSTMASHQEQTGGSSDFGAFTSMLTGGGGADAAKAKGADPNVINSLLGEFEQQTGQKFGGSDAEYTILQKLATDKTGLPFEKTILKKLVEWKMQSMF